VTEFPYRFRATEGASAGTTYIYYRNGTTVTYRTDAPETYHTTLSTWHSRQVGKCVTMIQEVTFPVSSVMTPKELERFEAIPLGGGT
jgi:hypothetical protein